MPQGRNCQDLWTFSPPLGCLFLLGYVWDIRLLGNPGDQVNDLVLTVCRPHARLSGGLPVAGYLVLTAALQGQCVVRILQRESRKVVTLTTFLLCDLGQVT